MPVTYSINQMDLSRLRAEARGTSRGGQGPPVPLHSYPLLAWMPHHHRFGGDVFTEDQAAGVSEIAAAVPGMPSFDALAEKFGTTPDHIRQALDYAVTAGTLV